MKSIRELLTGRKPLTLSPGATVHEAAKAMQAEHVGAVFVVDADGRLAGCFTERDVMTRVVVPELDPATTKLEAVMTTELFSCHPDRRANEVASEMQARHIRHLPVLEEGELMAVLSLRDVLRAHLETKRAEVQQLTAYIQGEVGPEEEKPADPSG